MNHHLFSDETDMESAMSAQEIWASEDVITRPENATVSEALPFKGMRGYDR
ncbi:hypothetical protein ACFV5G_05745 [Streptomyces sp. NPDC059766]|uniref:hypothetical protein n=1 Tax=Streptomyces sp. NPDC059766 TaxID=3346940 RepID=UPI003665EA9F